jgi:hypothetical protein
MHAPSSIMVVSSRVENTVGSLVWAQRCGQEAKLSLAPTSGTSYFLKHSGRVRFTLTGSQSSIRSLCQQERHQSTCILAMPVTDLLEPRTLTIYPAALTARGKPFMAA